MKAARIHEYGGVEVVRIEEIDRPKVGSGQVLVEVHGSSLNPFDTSIRSGRAKDWIPHKLPVTLGGDIAGIVSEVGEGVTNVKKGDKVWGQANVAAGNSGAWAEFAVTKAQEVATAPDKLDFTDLASLPLVGVSALQALTEHIKLEAGQKIFINGGGGGIGGMAIQMAHHLGAHVAATSRGKDLNYLKELGADEAIDYETQDYAELVHDYDAVFDTVGGAGFEKTLDVLKKGGIAVSMQGIGTSQKAKELGVTAVAERTNVTTDALDQLRKLVDSGAVKPQIAKVFNLEEIGEAFTYREGNSINGKVVLRIR